MADSFHRRRSVGQYTVGVICPMGVELAPVKAMLDHVHPDLPTQRELNRYTLGDIEGHNVVIAVLPETGTNAPAIAATQLLNDFPAIQFGLSVGLGAGVPDENEEDPDVRLGDVVISKPTSTFGGVVQFKRGKALDSDRFERTGSLDKPPAFLRSTVEKLAADHRIMGSRVPAYLSMMLEKYPAMREDYSYPGLAADVLFRADYLHVSGKTCRDCSTRFAVDRDERRSTNPRFHYGTIGSSDLLIRSAALREQLRQEFKLICIEMGAADIMDAFPCLVIRGVCDYADSHKNKKWQPYAAATAAAYMRELLSVMLPRDLDNLPSAAKILRTGADRHYFQKLRFLDSLKFDTMNGRLNQIKPAEFGTFGWIFDTDPRGDLEHKSDVARKQMAKLLSDWLGSNDCVFFLQGKVGSGKSTLMKFLFQHQCTRSNLQIWSQGKPVTIMFHAFWRSGVKEQHSLKGLLSSLLHQILSKNQGLLETYIQDDSICDKSHFNDWSVEELLQFSCRCFRDAHEPLCLFLDGIDEFDGEDDIDRLFDFLARMQNVTARLKLCVSSRPEAYIAGRLARLPSLRLQDLNAQDIRTYVSKTLSAKVGQGTDVGLRQNELTNLIDVIQEKADGVFLWVALALQNICRGLGVKVDLTDLLQRIAELPSELSKLYSHIRASQHDSHTIHLEGSRRLFRVMKRQNRKLVPLIRVIAAMDPQIFAEYLHTHRPVDEKRFGEVCSLKADNYVARSAGLLECVSIDSMPDPDVHSDNDEDNVKLDQDAWSNVGG